MTRSSSSLFSDLRRRLARLVAPPRPRLGRTGGLLRTASTVERLENRQLFAVEVGMNLDRIVDYSPAWTFTDAFQSSRSWISYSYNTATGATTASPPGTPIAVDAHGWPTQLSESTDAQGRRIQQRLGTMMFDSIDGRYPAGVYRAEWRGEGTLVWQGDARVAQTGVEPDGTHYALLNVAPTRLGIQLRIDAIDSADPIRDVHVWMPDYQDQAIVRESWRPGDDHSPFHPLYRERLDPFATVRFIQPQNANSTDEVRWSDRRTLDHARQAAYATDFQNGLAPEYIVQTANELQSNAWIALPHQADDDYIRNLATLVRDQLDPNLKVYIEWSNEVWNYTPGFDAHPWVRAQVPLPQHDPAFWPTFYQIAARETKRDFDIWSEVFAGQSHRLVRTVSGQAANSWVARQIVQHMGGAFDAIACDGYVTFAQPQLARFNADTTVDQVVNALFTEALPHTLEFLRQHDALAREYSTTLGREIQTLVYEGGVLLPGTGRPYQQAFLGASRDPRMYELYQQLLDGADQAGVELFNAYVLTDTSPFADASHLRYMDQPIEEAHKYRSLIDYIDATADPPPPPPPTNIGPENVVPGDQSIAARTPLIFSAAGGNAIQITDADAGRSTMRVELAATGGLLTLSRTDGLTSSTGDGGESIVVEGPLAAVNAALDGLTFVSTGPGDATALIRIATTDVGATGAGGPLTDVDEVTVETVGPALVRSVVINDGHVQRSMVRTATIEFDRPVQIDAGAFALARSGGPPLSMNFTPGVYSSITLTFGGPYVEPGGSLMDGAYRLLLRGEFVRELRFDQPLDGDADGSAGGDRTDEFFRLFGDSDGDRDVDLIDARAFARSFGARRTHSNYRDYFDVNSDGRIDGWDKSHFVRRQRRPQAF